MLAGIHQLYQSHSENRLARPSLFPPPKPNPLSPTPLAVSLRWDRGQVGLWARKPVFSVSLVAVPCGNNPKNLLSVNLSKGCEL